MAYKLDHIHFRCENLEAAADYYVKVFDGKILNRAEVRGLPIVQIEIAGERFFLSPKRAGDEVEPNSGKSRWGVYQIALTIEDMDATVKKLKARGAEFEGDPIAVNPSLKVAFIKGPDNVQIELLQRS
jgi:catechol 2,3-dioxygenase-like lactoylglutathione lyase family enzyme